jgi:CRP-like cAMP-binding protein
MYDFLPPLFQGMSPTDLASALQRFKTLDVEAGVRIIEEGEEDPTLVVVHSGELAVKSGTTVLGKVRAGDLVGEMALFGGGMRTANVETVTSCKLLALDWDAYDYLRRAKHPIAYALEDHALVQLTDRLRAIRERIGSRARGTSVERATQRRTFFEKVAEAIGAGGTFDPGTIDGAEVLARSPLFAGASADVLGVVAQLFVPVGARTGHFLITEGDAGDEMYIVASGSVDVLVATQGDRVQPVATLEAGEAFGFCSLVQPGQPRMASCVAREKLTALSMDKLRWAEAANRGDVYGSVLRVAMIRALAEQLSYANTQLTRLDEQGGDLGPLVQAAVAVEAHGRFLKPGDDVPDYLRGVAPS